MFGSNNIIKDLKKNLGKSKVQEQLKQELFKLLKSDDVSEEIITKVQKAIDESTSDVLESVTKPKRVMVDKNNVIYKCSTCDFRSRDKKAKCARHPLGKMTLWNQK